MSKRVKGRQNVRRMRIGCLDRECTACEDKEYVAKYAVATFTDETSVLVVLRQ